jgi:hypothetical protein
VLEYCWTTPSGGAQPAVAPERTSSGNQKTKTFTSELGRVMLVAEGEIDQAIDSTNPFPWREFS